MTLLVALVTLAAVFGGLLTFFLHRVLLRHAVLDQPNERSMHRQPVPRGGGLAIMLVMVPGLALAFYLQGHFMPQGWLLFALLLLIAVSWLDDRKGLHPGIRLAAHLLAATLGSFAFTHEQTIFGSALPFWVDRVLMIVGWAWFMNITNFMDGIDGIAGIEAISIAIGAGLILSLLFANDPFSYALIALLVGACGGFLVFNWHPAVIFLGDVGSIPLGFLTGYFLIVLATLHQLAPALILPLVYLADSSITLARRLLRGEKVWHAHCEHFYQRATQAAGRHDTVVLWIALANIALIGTAILAVLFPLPGLGLALVIVALLLGKMHKASQS
jgi:UDP-N-acetylmuramyl pentapeptide phosphotransferase/UDP-N-acetylglucosamine-1-phosphate transferase